MASVSTEFSHLLIVEMWKMEIASVLNVKARRDSLGGIYVFTERHTKYNRSGNAVRPFCNGLSTLGFPYVAVVLGTLWGSVCVCLCAYVCES